jgi:signal transduction histidine kinase/DNA repair protein RadC
MNFLRVIREGYNKSFRAKVFVKFFVLLITISISFMLFIIHQQNKSLTDDLIKDGLSLSKLVAYNSRLGVYAENPSYFKGSIEGAMQREEVVYVSVYTSEGKRLTEQGNPRIAVNIEEPMKRLIETGEPVHYAHEDCFEFWAPVISRTSEDEESLFFYAELAKQHTIGFVRIIIGKDHLYENFSSIIFKSIAIAIIFIVIGSVIIYFIARGVTGPLNRLTEGVSSLEKGDSPSKISTTSKDEIGRLTGAFNHMAKSLKQREVEKQRLMEKLNQSHRLEAIGTLAGGIAHDFNNILTIIQSNIELAQAKAPDYIRNYAEKSLKAINRGNDLIRRLLHFEHGSSLNIEPINIGLVVQETIRLIKDVIDQRIRTQINIVPDLWAVNANAGQIQQVLINLITNAKDAILDVINGENGKEGNENFIIEIGLSNIEVTDKYRYQNPQASEGEYVLIAVKDNGCGMDKYTALRIFEPFYSTKETGKGTGLGLSTVYGIVKSHGGWIDVQSKAGKGSEFLVYLPKSSDKIKQARTKKEQFETAGGAETILIVDDEKDILDATKEKLEELGYKVIVADNGKTALEMLSSGPRKIDLVILDHIMPEILGMELLSKILHLNQKPKVIVCSGKDLRDHVDALDGIDFIQKPFNLDELSDKVRRLLGGRKEHYMKTQINRLKLYCVAENTLPYKEEIKDSLAVYEIFRHIANESREIFIVLFLDIRNKIIGYDVLSVGTTDKAIVYPKEVVKMALMVNANSVILIHNHPSGDLIPSNEDIIITAAILQSLNIMDLKLLDHIIISHKGFYSFSEEGEL